MHSSFLFFSSGMAADSTVLVLDTTWWIHHIQLLAHLPFSICFAQFSGRVWHVVLQWVAKVPHVLWQKGWSSQCLQENLQHQYRQPTGILSCKCFSQASKVWQIEIEWILSSFELSHNVVWLMVTNILKEHIMSIFTEREIKERKTHKK